MGLDNELKPLPFSPAAARIFFVRPFHFIPLSKVVLFFAADYWLTSGSLFFSISVFKIIPRFAVLTFFVSALV